MPPRPALLLAAALLLGAADAPPPFGTEFAQVTIRERVLIRIRPQRPLVLDREGRVTRTEPVWRERRAQQCVAVHDLAGAAVSRGGDVDLFLVDGKRLRAKLAVDCPALDFYRGFYLRPNADGRICGGRDELRARSGARCPVMRFRRIELRH